MAAPLTRYEILGHLASGGMGEILLARRLGPAGFEKRVVLKRPLGATTRAHVTALIDEARLLARINHPNVCQVLDLEEGEAGYFLVLEHLEGMSCWTLLIEAERAAVALPPGALCGLLEQVCDGLEAIHTLAARDGRPAGIVHRDISPGNLFVTGTGVAKILDLGIAKTDEGNTTAPGSGPRGKLPYLSPEQIAGRAVDRRADLFSLGLVLYDLARGRPPMPHRVGALAALELDAIPAPLADVIRTAVAIDPAQRFATAVEMAAALRRAGSASGGSLGRAELAAWLAAQFADVLAARRAQLPGAAGGGAPAPPPVTRVELRSLVRDAGDGAEPTVVDAPPGAHDAASADRSARDPSGEDAWHATAELAPPPPLIRERSHPAIGQVEALVAAAGAASPRPPAQRPRRLATIAFAAALAVTLGAAAWWGSADEPSRSLPAPTGEASVVATAQQPSRTPARGAGAAASALAPGRSPVGAIEPAEAPAASSPASEEPCPESPATLAAWAGASASGASAGSPAISPATAPAVPTSDPGERASGAPERPPGPPPRRSAAAAEARAGRPGRLSVDSEPFAVIELDGKPLGTTPLYRLPVAPGRHQLRAETGSGRVQRRAIDVAPGAVSAVVLRWAAGADDGR